MKPQTGRSGHAFIWINSWITLTLAVFTASGFLLTHLDQVAVRYWNLILLLSMIVSGAVLFTASRRGISSSLPSADWAFRKSVRKQDLLRRWLPFGVLIPGFIAVLLSARLQISFHGFFHSAYIHQILAGIIPPENVTLPGTPANVYWIYHALLACIVSLTHLPAPLVSALTNLVLLILTLGWLREIIRLVVPESARSGQLQLMALFSLFCLNLTGFLNTLAVTAVTQTPLLRSIKPIALFGDIRLNTVLGKYLNFNGFPFGLLFFTFLIHIVARMLAGRIKPFDLFLSGMAVIGAMGLHTTSGMFLLIVIPAAFVAARITANTASRRHTESVGTPPGAAGSTIAAAPGHRWIGLGVTCTLLALPAIPAAHFVRSVAQAFPVESTIEVISAYDVKSILAVSWPLLPFFIPGILSALRRVDRPLLFVIWVCLLGLGISCLFGLPDRNEYKFVILSTIAMGIVSSVSLHSFLVGGRTQNRPAPGTGIAGESPIPVKKPGGRLWRSAAMAAVACLLVNLLATGMDRFLDPWFGDRTFRYEGRHVSTAGTPFFYPGDDLQYGDLYRWIRENSDPHAIVVIPLEFRNKSVDKDRCSLLLLAERLPYVIHGGIYNHGLTETVRRQRVVRTVYDPHSTAAERQQALADISDSLPGRRLLVVLPRTLEGRLDLQSPGLTLVHSGRFGLLYADEE